MNKLNNYSSKNDIPDTWSEIPLYEIRNKKDRYGFTGGPFGSDLKSEHYTQSGVKVLQLQNIGEGKFIDKGIVYTSAEKANELISCNIYPNEIILAKMAPVARCCKVPSTDERYVMCSDGIRLSVDTGRFDNEFVFQALNSKYFRDEADSKSTGTTRARIGLNELKQICIAVPKSLPEQQKIAEILSTVDNKIELIDQQIIETQVLKKGLMQRLLTKGIGHTEFKDSVLGMIPKSWELVPIYELRNKNDRYGFTGGPFGSDLKSEHYTETGVKIIQLQNIGEGKFIDKGIAFTSEKKADELSSCNIFPNEIILAKMAPVARCCKVPSTDERYVMCSDGIRLSIDTEEYDNEFVFQALNSKYFRDEAESKSTGTTRARIGLKELKQIPILVPKDKQEQKQVASILSTIDDKLSTLSEKKIHYQELKQGLMQQLLTGKIRVKV